jgi:flagellar basal-body rod protein FlgB
LAFLSTRNGNPLPRGRFLPPSSHSSHENQWRISFGGQVALAVHVFDRVTNQIEHYMDLLSTRQKLVASNIANVDTPGYKTKDIDFQFEFISLAQDAQPNVVEAQGLVVKSDGNNVNMDREARLLSETALRFNIASNLMRSEFKSINNAIQEGKTGG